MSSLTPFFIFVLHIKNALLMIAHIKLTTNAMNLECIVFLSAMIQKLILHASKLWMAKFQGLNGKNVHIVGIQSMLLFTKPLCLPEQEEPHE